MSTIERYRGIQATIAQASQSVGRDPDEVQLVAVSKTFDIDDIRPVIREGHRIFGENRVQEAKSKWPALKSETPDLELRLIGPLQSNKTEDAVALFDVIESVDREKIARAIAKEMERQNRKLRLYVQVNTGSEPQKAGVDPRDVRDFVAVCRQELGLTVCGLMCIPPFDENPGPHFALLAKLARENDIGKLSMGMSADYETAIAFGATSVRVGSAIFGTRGKPTTAE